MKKINHWTDDQKAMITEDGNVRRYIDSDIVDKFEIGDCADLSFPRGYNKYYRVFHKLSVYHCNDSEVFVCKSKKIRQVGNIMQSGHRKNPNQGRVYDQRFCAPSLTASQGGGRQPFIIVRKK